MSALDDTLAMIKVYFKENKEFPSPEWLSRYFRVKLKTLKNRLQELRDNGQIVQGKGGDILSLPTEKNWLCVPIVGFS